MTATFINPFRFAAAGPTTLVSDDFSEANGTNLNGKLPDVGPAWAVSQGGLGVQSGKAVCTSRSAPFFAGIGKIESGAADKTVQATLKSGAADGGVGLRVRVADDTNFLLLYVISGALPALYKNVAGAYTSLGGGGTNPGTAETAFAVVANGSSLTVKQAGSTIITATDATGASNTADGVYIDGNGAPTCTIDDFLVTTP